MKTAILIPLPLIIGTVLALVEGEQTSRWTAYSGQPTPTLGTVAMPFLVGLFLTVLFALGHLKHRSPRAYQALKDGAKIAGTAYLAYEVYEGVRRHERHEDYLWEQRHEHRNDGWQL